MNKILYHTAEAIMFLAVIAEVLVFMVLFS